LTGLCSELSSRGLIKILSLNLSGGTEEIHATLHSEYACWSRFELGNSAQKSNLGKFNCCNISVEVGNMTIVRIRNDVTLMRVKILAVSDTFTRRYVLPNHPTNMNDNRSHSDMFGPFRSVSPSASSTAVYCVFVFLSRHKKHILQCFN
jgi:hypothetical protein